MGKVKPPTVSQIRERIAAVVGEDEGGLVSAFDKMLIGLREELVECTSYGEHKAIRSTFKHAGVRGR